MEKNEYEFKVGKEYLIFCNIVILLDGKHKPQLICDYQRDGIFPITNDNVIVHSDFFSYKRGLK